MDYLANLAKHAGTAKEALAVLGKDLKGRITEKELSLMRKTYSQVQLLHRSLILLSEKGTAAPKPTRGDIEEALGAIPTLAEFKEKVAQLKPHQLEVLILLIDKLDLEVK